MKKATPKKVAKTPPPALVRMGPVDRFVPAKKKPAKKKS